MKEKLYEEDGGAAASASINKTLKEIEAILEGGNLPNAGELRSKLRATLIESFEGVGKQWYRRGFNRGHRESYSAFKEKGKVPKSLKLEKSRKIVTSGSNLKIKLRSRIKST
ncbi:hypothetical protein [Pseudoalteromonas rhizosphaerae]|uniref:hypothetical protein n=1 Tax=Pseudoalteromonas rhizosphaerae TaxID=2518973 RepID=UPI00384F9B68